MDRSRAHVTSPRTRIARDDRGFTIIESLTAATILLVVAVGVMLVLVTTSGWYAQAAVRTMASTVANKSMSLTLSRNSTELHYASEGESWPAAIPFSRTETTSIGVYSVETSMALATDPATGFLMTRITVTVDPVNQRLDPPVSIIRYASGWQGMASSPEGLKVPVQVQCSIRAAGVRVQLLAPDNFSEARYAVTDSNGLAVFKDVTERSDGYFLTSDPRFGTDIRPEHFPTRILPTHGGSINNPILFVNKYTLQVVRSAVPAVLRIGVYRDAGWRFSEGQPVSTTLPYSTIYTPGDSERTLTVYAKPNLNAGAGDGLYGGVGAQTRYPNDAMVVNSAPVFVYSAKVNAYGVACIEVPWTTEAVQGQSWTVWCTTDGADGRQRHTINCSTAITGGWPVDALSSTRPELPSSGVYLEIPQWSFLGAAVAAVPPDPTPPAR
ncbi:MAG TPA: prepilin-type N-terminal cleavage/methylation domain-containing protein [Propionibacteriaceae bacterium]